jgi:sulfide:quinone oxidoreductase
MAKIVVLGAGVAGIPAALEIRKKVRKSDEVLVVSNTPTFHFVPSNPWVAVGRRRPEQIKVGLVKMFRRHKIGFSVNPAVKVHPKENLLELADGSKLDYDFLVIATGPRLAFDEIPGFGPAGCTKSVCHVDHAEETNSAWQDFLKNPGPIVVGAVQGASCFGPAYEYVFLLDAELRKRKIRDKVPITFLTSEPYIGHLGLGGVGDTKGLFESALREKTIQFKTNVKINQFEKNRVSFTEVDEDGTDKRSGELPFALSMMIPAFTGVEAVRNVEGLSNARGMILVNDFMQNPTFSNVYGVGVCVAIPPFEKTPIPIGVPKTGLMMESMGVAAAHNIRAQLEGQPPHARPALNALCIADMGDNGVGFIAQPQIPPRNRSITMKGWKMHLAKVIFEVYYLRKIRRGLTSPFYEKWGLGLLGYRELKH